MKLRNVRMPNRLWRELKALAAIRDEKVADLVRGHLESLVRHHRSAIREYLDSHPEITAAD